MGDQKFGAAKNTYTAHVTPSNTGTDGTIGQRTFPAERRGNALQRALLWFLNLTDASPLPWYKWPLLSVWPLVYLYLRRVLLRLNLVDIPQPKNTDIGRKLKGYEGRASLEHFFRRDDNGWGNDVDHPDAGAQFATIGRNMAYIPTDALDPFEDPHPQLVAQKLLARTFFRPAGMQLNVMAAAWIQAMIHDWQDHELEKNLDKRVELAHKTNPVCPLANFKLRPTYNHGTDGAHVYLNTRTGWWDASFVYGQVCLIAFHFD
jgi:alpha-dioxygenase